ncbi:MAG: LysR family transcriptional regulator [Paracoccaceae bacterium]
MLVALHAFDLVARFGNLSGAADALGVTQSAISQKIKALEAELGVSLFRREHRGVSLTNEGLRLLNVVRPAMSQLGSSVEALLERKSRPRVRISADFSFATFWLLPQLSDLRDELGDEIEIQILASQAPPEKGSEDWDINIHIQSFNTIGKGEVALLRERVAAVCSPGFLAENGPIASSESLLDLQLLSLSKPPSAHWQTWQGWFEGLGISDARSKNYISFNNYDMVTQSAIAGNGVALGWLGLVDGLIQQDLLVQVTEDVVVTNAGYVMSRDQSSTRRGPKLVFDWIEQRAANPTARRAVSVAQL